MGSLLELLSESTKQKQMKLCIVGVLLVVGYSQASCFGKDAGFNPRTGKPVVSQPSRNDPKKVMVDWTAIAKNPQCADGYNVLVWADGMPQTTAQRHPVAKNVKSKIIDVQPCVKYRFAVESLEKNTLGQKKVLRGDSLFSTAGSATKITLKPTDFHVSYLWDPVKKVTDLKQATLSIRQDQVPGVSCLDFIQVTGVARRASSSSRPPVGSSRSRQFSWGHMGQFNPQISVGGASTLPAQISRGSSSSSRRGSTSSTSSRSSSSGNLFSSSSSKSNTYPAPQYANTLPRAKGGATHNVGPIRVQPPFINGSITIVVPVKDCAEYDFEVKFMAKSKGEVGKVTGVHLPSLADVPGYVPPPITSVMSITYGSNGKPVYGVKTASGVNAACLPAYFEAYDAYMHRLENEVTWMGREGNRVTSLVSGTQNTLTSSQEELLRKAGCVCTSPHLNMSTADASLNKKKGDIMGHFQFQGMHADRPFYKLVDHGQPASSGSRPAVNARPVPEQYLFWDVKHKQWMFGPKLGKDSGVDFGSVQNSPAKCPGDPPANNNWQYKSSVLGRWKPDRTMKVTCEIRSNRG